MSDDRAYEMIEQLKIEMIAVNVLLEAINAAIESVDDTQVLAYLYAEFDRYSYLFHEKGKRIEEIRLDIAISKRSS